MAKLTPSVSTAHSITFRYSPVDGSSTVVFCSERKTLRIPSIPRKLTELSIFVSIRLRKTSSSIESSSSASATLLDASLTIRQRITKCSELSSLASTCKSLSNSSIILEATSAIESCLSNNLARSNSTRRSQGLKRLGSTSLSSGSS